MLSISPLPCFADNYIWVLRRDRDVVAVDPGDAVPLLDYLKQENLTLAAILITHRHHDHIGGLPALLGRAPVYGPGNVPGVTHPVTDADTIKLLGEVFSVLATPGHTEEHVCYYGAEALFCGDTLFAGGCGRVNDGPAEQLYTSLRKLAALPDTTQVCCAHEYTLANLRFAAEIEPDNVALTQRISIENTKRAAGLPTLPSSIELERATNPFLRCEQATVISAAKRQNPDCASPASVFTALRTLKNHFK